MTKKLSLKRNVEKSFENSKLVKLIAPEWTIVEIRDKIKL